MNRSRDRINKRPNKSMENKEAEENPARMDPKVRSASITQQAFSPGIPTVR